MRLATQCKSLRKFNLRQLAPTCAHLRLLAGPFDQGLNITVYIGLLTLNLGQTDSQVVASSGKLNLGRDLRWVAKRTGKFPHKYTQVAKNPFQGKHFLYLKME